MYVQPNNKESGQFQYNCPVALFFDCTYAYIVGFKLYGQDRLDDNPD